MDPLTTVLVQYGAVGVLAVAALLAARVLWQKGERDRAAMEEDHDQELVRMQAGWDAERVRGDRLETELARANGAMQSVLVDTLGKTTTALNEAAHAVADALAAVRRS